MRSVLIIAGLCWISGTAHGFDRRLLPADTEEVVLMNIRQTFVAPGSVTYSLQQSGGLLIQRAVTLKAVKLLRENVRGLNQALEVVESSGFELARDLDTVVTASSGSRDVADRFYILEGRFDQDKFLRTADKIGFRRKGSNLAVCKMHPSGWFSVVGGKSLVFATSGNVLEDALTRIEKNQFVATKVAGLLEELNDVQTFSFVMTSELVTKHLGGVTWPGEKGASGAITISGDVQFELRAICKDGKSAKKLADAVTPFIPIARNWVADQARRDEKLAPLVDIAATLRADPVRNHCIVTANASFYTMARLLRVASD